MCVKHVEAFGNLLLVVQQVIDVLQCFDELLNAYLDKCWDDFTMQHVSRDENIVVNNLTQQASGFRSNRGKFNFLEKNGCFSFPNWKV
jgi:hypothetical protein